ncbi:hypothetical protein DXT63_15855 [Thermoanaerobacteraceae bacterium SP2]|nr:hypothetical protein DXT63_15855 [Thermoanaerobacteraceae bacterium SP2]
MEREKEAQLREKRGDLEISNRSMLTILKRDEHFTMQVGVAPSFFQREPGRYLNKLSDISQK